MRTFVQVSWNPSCAEYFMFVCAPYGVRLNHVGCGRSPEAAAAQAAFQMRLRAATNPEGGDLVAPPEVMNLVPESLRKVR